VERYSNSLASSRGFDCESKIYLVVNTYASTDKTKTKNTKLTRAEMYFLFVRLRIVKNQPPSHALCRSPNFSRRACCCAWDSITGSNPRERRVSGVNTAGRGSHDAMMIFCRSVVE